LFRSFISSWRDHHHPHPHELVVHHDYTPFRFTDPHHHHHHHYDPTASYYADAAMDSYASSSAAAASVYSPYMVHHHSPPPSSNSPSIKPETAATTAAALQSALSLSSPMNVNVSMNFNSHNIQYATGYNVPTPTANLSYEPFYGSNRHPVTSSSYHHHNSMPSEIKNRSDPVATKQAMLLSAAATYDYKDLSKLCEFFPTPSSSAGSNEKRKYVLYFIHNYKYLIPLKIVLGYKLHQHLNHQIIKLMKDE
jgi:hypothetical protein